jgi:hypothetical protein
MLVAKRIAAAVRPNIGIGGYGSRIGVRFAHLSGTTEMRPEAVIVRLDRTIRTPRLLDSIIGVSGILDRPVKPGDDM